MLSFLKKRRYRKTINSSGLMSRINHYLLNNYTPPAPPPSSSAGVRYSVSPKHECEDDYEDAFCDPFDDIFRIFNKPSIDELKPLSRPVEEINADLEESVEMSFVDKLLGHISEKKLRDTQVYKAAHIDRKLFSKIASNRHYTPSKDTCLALCFALQLSLEESKDLLSRAEHALTHSNKRDIVIEYLIRERVYDLFEVNEILERLDMKPFGP